MPKQNNRDKTHCPRGHEYTAENTYPGGHGRRCRACAKAKVIERRLRNRALINALRTKPCLDCKNTFPFYVMQFDHLPQYEKLFCIAVAHDYGTDTLLREIAKCEVICANCHAIRTYERSR